MRPIKVKHRGRRKEINYTWGEKKREKIKGGKKEKQSK